MIFGPNPQLEAAPVNQSDLCILSANLIPDLAAYLFHAIDGHAAVLVPQCGDEVRDSGHDFQIMDQIV
jgi:hypothetical protein